MLSRVLCWLGAHIWVSCKEDYIREFGYIPTDSRIARDSVCKCCDVRYGDTL